MGQYELVTDVSSSFRVASTRDVHARGSGFGTVLGRSNCAGSLSGTVKVRFKSEISAEMTSLHQRSATVDGRTPPSAHRFRTDGGHRRLPTLNRLSDARRHNDRFRRTTAAGR